jgi:hypothetical protein
VLEFDFPDDAPIRLCCLPVLCREPQSLLVSTQVLDYNQGAAVYFIAAIVICSFFYANLFVGAVVDAYDS